MNYIGLYKLLSEYQKILVGEEFQEGLRDDVLDIMDAIWFNDLSPEDIEVLRNERSS